MPMSNYTTGRDVTVQVYGNDGQIHSFSMITMFNSRQETNDIRIKRLDGQIDILRIPDGWQGTIEFTRQTSELDDYIANLEQNYYNGQNIQPAQITETIQEVTGGITQYKYVGVFFKLDDAGDIRGDDAVKQRLSWMGTQRLKIQ